MECQDVACNFATTSATLIGVWCTTCLNTAWYLASSFELHYGTGKRISQKLLRNCVKFLSIIHDVLKVAPREYIKQSSDEIDIRGPESKYDSRKINSYPSKVGIQHPFSVGFNAILGALLHGRAAKTNAYISTQTRIKSQHHI